MNDIERARAKRLSKSSKHRIGISRQVSTATGEVFIGMYADGKLIWDGPRAEFFTMIHQAWREGKVTAKTMAGFMDIAK